MIQVEGVRIEEFRGIRDLSLQLGCENFVVWGPNGSGKSGVVDALDFALTGDIARLSGPGTGGISVLKHGPHVFLRDDPGAAKVSLSVRDTVSGDAAVLTRCVKTSNEYTLSPDIESVRAAVEQARQHPELTLSRREIIKYIIAEPTKRADQVQALLKLDRLTDLRSLLKSAQSKATAASKTTAAEVTSAVDALQRHLDLAALSAREVASAVNKRREVLGLDPLKSVADDTELLAGDDHQLSTESGFNRASALRDVQALVDWADGTAEKATVVSKLGLALGELDRDPNSVGIIQQHALVESGLELLVDDLCPLCDTSWPSQSALRLHLQEKLERTQAAMQLKQRILDAATGIQRELRQAQSLVQSAAPHTAHGTAELEHRLRVWATELATLNTQLSTLEGVVEHRERVSVQLLTVPPGLLVDLQDLLGVLRQKADQSVSVDARSFLTIAQDRITRLRLARAADETACATAASVRKTYQSYCEAVDEELSSLYATVEGDFSAYYKTLNAEDEPSFKASLDPSAGKLDLSVDFYGQGMFPPGAYHSEGHQDGMGVCLYLALVKQLLGESFRFAVLDDVVMSVDSNHRRKFCELLRTSFPDVQFVITTHDKVWAQEMRASGLVKKAAQARFYGWTVDCGPAHEAGADYLDHIQRDLARDDVPAAAARLRRNLESSMADLAASLGASVPYREDGDYDLGQFLGGVNSRHGKLLGLAAKSAVSWSNTEAQAIVAQLKADRSTATLLQQDEQWLVNKAVHYNSWANLSTADFVPVLDAWMQFLALFSCSSCESTIFVVGPPADPQNLRCSCGAYNLNLQAKRPG